MTREISALSGEKVVAVRMAACHYAILASLNDVNIVVVVQSAIIGGLAARCIEAMYEAKVVC